MPMRSDAVVLFGVTGDLVSKKLFPALYELTRRGRLDVPVIGVARSPWDDQQLVSTARKSVSEANAEVDDEAFDALARNLSMISGDYADPFTYQRLAERLRDAERPIFYLAIPPAVFGAVVDGLAAAGLAERGRVIVEKPFGRDLTSSRELDRTLRAAFDPRRVFRIDHYLGKEAVEGLYAFRFANRLFEPLWNSEHIDNIQVTLAEGFGTQGRAGFYDRVGATRDVLQNHILQVVALIAMDAPAADDIDAFREAESAVLRQIEPLSPDSTVRGQYAGYRDEPGVAPDSNTETFVATRLTVNSPRWAGVPFYLRTGKSLPGTATEVVVEFKQPQRSLIPAENGAQAPANLLRFRLGRGDGITMSIQAKSPGAEVTSRPVDLSVDFGAAFGRRQEAYERLLDDAMDGQHLRFARAETIEQEWRIVGPILDLAAEVQSYDKGTWGPADADALAGGWHTPDLR
ncbi:glucose-6-phosphate dehydrogenase [Micromonospora sp. STR1_7]|uniref:Glucose-6-phosphate 1-dehydrogenase n=1 Tax=Micromonospora parastrephiae TaxID=2806101 RepID=A0ABS1XP96_9ACTN|nr:glucose-6-phosphate dehydrogenase [Micromonospora parastrephiae]MBM0231072.1 glucose-6-phosphate dehydrogenase [Micromonospora parastrephiae]